MRAAAPETVVTLGNAAARVLAALAGQPGRSGVLTADSYGQERHVNIDGHALRWQALVHPAPPKTWAERHEGWRNSR